MPPRQLLRYEQIRRRGDQPDVQESDALYAEGRYFEASCLSGAVINECVKVNGTNLGRPRVRRCDPEDALLMPMTGIIVQKMSPQVCLVQVSGLIQTLPGLLAGEQYFVGAGGIPVTPTPSVSLLQLVGIALSDTKLLLYPNQTARSTIVTSDIYGEIPAGFIDGINRRFTLSSPMQAGTLRLFLNGVRLRVGALNDYTEFSTTQIDLVYPPKIGDTLLADYRA